MADPIPSHRATPPPADAGAVPRSPRSSRPARRRRRRRSSSSRRATTRRDAAAPPPPDHDHARGRHRALGVDSAATPFRAATTKGGDIAGLHAHPTPRPRRCRPSARRPSTRCRAASSRSTSTRTGCTSTCRPVPTTRPGGSRRPTSPCPNPLEYQIKVSLADYKLTLFHNGVVEFEAPARDRHRREPDADRHLLLHRPARSRDTSPTPRYGVFAHRPVRPQRHAQRVRRRRRPDRDPRHQRPGHHRAERLARLCARATTT